MRSPTGENKTTGAGGAPAAARSALLRGSGVDQDMRRDGEAIYTAMYDGYAFEVAVMKDGHYPRDHEYPPVPADAVLGDCWHRFFVRMLEVVQSTLP